MNSYTADPYTFRPEDPFPLLAIEKAQSQYAKFHAEECDRHLGFDHAAAEARHLARVLRQDTNLRADLEDWHHLAPRVYLTTYLELRSILHTLDLQAGQRIVDLGCGYARIPFILQKHHPGVHFEGFEAVEDRVIESRRVLKLHHVDHARVECKDLLHPAFEIPPAHAYFAYDIGSQSDVDAILQRLTPQLVPHVKIAIRGERMRRGLEELRTGHPSSRSDSLGQNLWIYYF